jgi:acyl dehydratase
MALDPAYVGRSFPATEPYLVAREKIREFAEAIGAMDAIYHDPQAARSLGHPDVVAPPTFPIVVTNAALRQLIDDPGLGLDFSRVVHGDQRFTYHRPLRVGDRLVCVGTVADIIERAGNGFLTTRTEVTAEDGEPVVTEWKKLVIRAGSGN